MTMPFNKGFHDIRYCTNNSVGIISVYDSIENISQIVELFIIRLASSHVL